jgi:glycosyltransferase involved in cell wall biosynthesis
VLTGRARDGRRSLVIAPFFSLDAESSRPRAVASALHEFGTVTILTADFDHHTKRRRSAPAVADWPIRMLPTPAYRTNVGPRRLWSHLVFGLRSAWYFVRHRAEYDVVYATLPLNLAAFAVTRLAGRRCTIVDVVDIWPDVLPFPVRVRRIGAPVLRLWRQLYVLAVRRADLVLAVSDAFREETQRHRSPTAVPVRRVYIGQRALPESGSSRAPDDREPRRTIAYVGNIGRLYDFRTLLDAFDNPMVRASHEVVVIGEGDRRAWLLQEFDRRGIRHRYAGVVFEPRRLGELLRQAHWGFNGYVGTTAAFSYKATTYLAAGLPLLNSMGGDLHALVERERLGANYRAGDVPSLCEALTSTSDAALRHMRGRCETFFARRLELGAIERELTEYLREHIGAS